MYSNKQDIYKKKKKKRKKKKKCQLTGLFFPGPEEWHEFQVQNHFKQ
jgi:hypothetical protein